MTRKSTHKVRHLQIHRENNEKIEKVNKIMHQASMKTSSTLLETTTVRTMPTRLVEARKHIKHIRHLHFRQVGSHNGIPQANDTIISSRQPVEPNGICPCMALANLQILMSTDLLEPIERVLNMRLATQLTQPKRATTKRKTVMAA